MTIRPFTIAVPDAALSDLKQRLAQTRWPDTIPGSGWTYGLDLDYMRQLRDYWMNGFDWRACEADWNRLPQFLFAADGMEIHFIHVRGHARGHGPGPLPIILTHGWPGSFLEMLKIIPLLTDPQASGGDPADAFDVVVPSMPGYGFSSRPTRRGVDCFVMAELWVKLMRELGYTKFIRARRRFRLGCFHRAGMETSGAAHRPALKLNSSLLPPRCGGHGPEA